jgi:hypothetical protein
MVGLQPIGLTAWSVADSGKRREGDHARAFGDVRAAAIGYFAPAAVSAAIMTFHPLRAPRFRSSLAVSALFPRAPRMMA